MMPPVERPAVASRPRTLVVFVEPPELTATLLDPAGAVVAGPATAVLPPAAEPTVVQKLLWTLVETLDEYDRTTFVLGDSPTLGAGWDEASLTAQSMRPVKVVRATTLVSRPALTNQGTELVLSFGARFGAALFVDGHEALGFDLGAHRFRKKATYADYTAGKRGGKKWIKRVQRVIETVSKVFAPSHLYVTGRDAAKLQGLPPHVTLVPDRTLEAAFTVWA